MARTPVGDLVVVVPGIMGSRLVDGEGEPFWDLSGAAVLEGLRSLAGAAPRLAVRPGTDGTVHDDGVRAVGLMRGIHIAPGIAPGIRGYTPLIDHLERTYTLDRRPPGAPPDTPANLIPFAYDWRLSCRHSAALLKARIDEELGRWRASAPERSDAEVVLLCHSMGGLVGRYYVECLGGHGTTRRLVTLGTPHRGSVDALLHLVNGVRKGWRRLGVTLTPFARSLPSLHELLPDYACVEGPGGTLLRVDELPGLPGVDEQLLVEAVDFHREIREAAALRAGAPGYDLVLVRGVRQPTATTAAVEGERLVPYDTIGGVDEGGDGTVPHLSARPVDHAGPESAIRTPWERHGALHHHTAVRQDLYGWLELEKPFHRAENDPDGGLSVTAPELVAAGEPFEVDVTARPEGGGHDELSVSLELTPAGAHEPEQVRHVRNLGEGRYRTVLTGLAPGAYRGVVRAEGRPGADVTTIVLVGEKENHDGE